MNRAIALGRRALCAGCPTPCPQYLDGHLDHDNGQTACPADPPRWQAYKPLDRHQPVQRKGLGDHVAATLKPIAKATGLDGCKGCGHRQHLINKVDARVRRLFRKPMNTESCPMRRVGVFEELKTNGDFYISDNGDRITMMIPGAGVVTIPISKMPKGESPSRMVWGWDGDRDKPTIHPSLDVVGQWHGWLRGGYMRSC